MDARRADPMALAERRLAWLEQRQQVLAQNIAHADTPGYRPRDLRAFEQLLDKASPALARTSDRHLDARGGSAAKPDRKAETSPDGNGVSLDREALRVAETDQAHGLALGLHRRWAAMFRTVLGRAG